MYVDAILVVSHNPMPIITETEIVLNVKDIGCVLQFIERELLLLKLIRKLLKPGYCSENYLWRVTFLTWLLLVFEVGQSTIHSLV